MLKRPAPAAVLNTLVAASGATALVYEVLWLRGFSIVLGSTVYSMSCVLTAFMAGCALGAGLAARRLRGISREGRGRFVRIYGALELVIGCYGLASTVVLFLGQRRWLALLQALHGPSTLSVLTADVLFTFVALLIPTVCMGATLPFLVMAVDNDRDSARLYGYNVVGAAAGSLVASFVLIYFVGVIVSAFVTAAVNVLIFGLALLLARRLDAPLAPPESRIAEGRMAVAAGPPWPAALTLSLALLSGFLFFSLELVWNRILSLVLGNRIYVMSVALAIVLVCLGIGASLCTRLLRKTTPEAIVAGGYLVAAVSLCGGLFVEGALESGDSIALGMVVVLAIVLPAIAMGLVFPLLLILGTSRESRGIRVGHLYAANTIGAMVGAPLTGYVLFSALGSNRIVIVGSAVLLLLAGAVAWRRGAPSRMRLSLTAVGLAALAITISLRWNTKLSVVSEGDVLVLDEDAYGIFSVVKDEDGYLNVRCNRTELVFLFGHRDTQFVQESQAHLPLFFAKRHDNVLVVGSGYGITAGAASQWPDVHRVDAVEILPLMVKNASLFRSGNFDYYRDPKVHVHVADGRQFLAASSLAYDVISINMSDPYLPGASSLFSSEFYDAVRRSLAPGGVVCQHIFGPDTASLYHGFKRHFRYVAVVPAYENGDSVLGSQEPLILSRLDAFADPTLRKVLAGMWVSNEADLKLLLADGASRQESLEAEPPAFLNTDIKPALEFRRSPDVPLFFSNL